MSDTLPGPLDVLDFWFRAGPAKWFTKDAGFDVEIRERFGALMAHAADGSLDRWTEKPHSALALILLLDQFPRNVYRDSPKAFATDEKARTIADMALGKGFERAYPVEVRKFFFMPFMHSESLDDQGRCVELMMGIGDKDGLFYAFQHLELIRRFGRFPHRNPVFGRETTAEEEAFLKLGGFAG
ncbi:DUF924 family protein [Rhodobium gokarnense]|uniref:Uncharacterized protein (DUF924 family) n=1 Tax=Rhodobium gokarnense TaxID=364296 RepID=A0ABT3HE59_9HYPH|nr:DUF924 family protein [Rhodobium gokarnense]MCW2308614.1 uncharacterized protein (DUF924 family) [Rhodobium gokarnense]